MVCVVYMYGMWCVCLCRYVVCMYGVCVWCICMACGVCICMCLCDVYMSFPVCACGDQKLTLSPSIIFQLAFLRHDLLLNLELANLARLVLQ